MFSKGFFLRVIKIVWSRVNSSLNKPDPSIDSFTTVLIDHVFLVAKNTLPLQDEETVSYDKKILMHYINGAENQLFLK